MEMCYLFVDFLFFFGFSFLRLPSFCHMAAGDFELVPLWQRDFVGAALSLHSSVSIEAILLPNFSNLAPNAQI